MTTVLDSWAVLRYLEDSSPAAGQVARLLDGERPVMSWINLGEVFYVVRRLHGDLEAAGTVRDIREVLDPELPGADRILAAARIKADHPLAYADAFAAATAIAHDAELWTGDPELLVDGAPWRWRDLR
ncbi:MAG TPA: PIN domain-containing protein [Acidimicrobiales bacterium]|nr:PIN domain-containing protein [Acidimicrobiales bacterium]